MYRDVEKCADRYRDEQKIYRNVQTCIDIQKYTKWVEMYRNVGLFVKEE